MLCRIARIFRQQQYEIISLTDGWVVITNVLVIKFSCPRRMLLQGVGLLVAVPIILLTMDTLLPTERSRLITELNPSLPGGNKLVCVCAYVLYSRASAISSALQV